MNRKYDPDAAQHIRDGIEALGEPPPQEITQQEMLKGMVPLLESQRARGWSLSHLVDALRKLGLEVAESTLRKYLAAESKKPDTRRRSTRSARNKAASATLRSPPTNAHQTSTAPTEAPLPKPFVASRPSPPHGGFNEDV
jgi:hypothetical protein